MARTEYDESDDLLKRAVAATRELQLPEGPAPEITAQTLAALREKAGQSRSPLKERITHMSWKSKASALLAVAASVLAMYVILSNPAGGTRAFAAVAQALSNVRSATWKITTDVNTAGKTVTTTGTGMFLEPSRERIETNLENDRIVQIMDGTKDKLISLLPGQKLAMVFNLENVPPEKGSGLGKTFTGLREMVTHAQREQDASVERLDAEVIDGRQALVYRLKLGTVDVKLWADPQSLLPLRVEYTTPESRVVMSDFQVDLELDESLFSVEVPQGYKIQETTQIDVSKKPIMYLADALKLAAEHNDGLFPSALRGEDGIDGTMRRVAEASARELTNDPEALRRQATQNALTMGGAFGILFSLSPEENDFHYAGKDVRLGTPDTPIFWYRTSRLSPTYEVLYADMHVEEVAAENVPKVAEPDGDTSTTGQEN